ncbi:Insulin-like growth factor 1 receptor [Bulinus truncatus]|nr:Insulin-like growth factor 1 receptor [Bulinus truncatus]
MLYRLRPVRTAARIMDRCADAKAEFAHADNLKASEVFVGILPNKTNEVIITWEAPEKPNGRILQYNIRVAKVSGSEDQAPVHCINANNSREYRLHLEPGNYSIQVRAVSLAGNGTYSEPKYIFIPYIEADLELVQTHGSHLACGCSLPMNVPDKVYQTGCTRQGVPDRVYQTGCTRQGVVDKKNFYHYSI